MIFFVKNRKGDVKNDKKEVLRKKSIEHIPDLNNVLDAYPPYGGHSPRSRSRNSGYIFGKSYY